MRAIVAAGAEAVRTQLKLAPSAQYQARLLAAGAGRTVVDYCFFHAPGRAVQTAIAKFYPDAGGERAYATMRALGDLLARRPNALLAVPQALLYDAEQRLLLQNRVEGESLGALAAGPHAGQALHQVGAALAELHRLPLPGGSTLRLHDHISSLIRPHPRALGEYAPELAMPAQTLLEALVLAETAIDVRAIAAPIHRDVHLRQLFLGQKRVWLIDWDLFAHGDPALDVGNFCVYLLTHIAEGGSRAVSAFVAGYAQAGDAAVIGRAPLYAAFTYLRLACKRVRLQQPGWQTAATRLIMSGLRVLEEQNIYE